MQGRRKRDWSLWIKAVFGLLLAVPALGGAAAPATPALKDPGPPFIVLCYHRFLAKPDDAEKEAQAQYQLPLAEFKWQMQYLKDKGFTPISSQELKDHWFQGKPLPLKPVLITFDDGFRSVYRDAFPVIQKEKIPTVFFLYTKFIAYGEAALKRRMEGKEKNVKTNKKTDALHDADMLEMQKSDMDFESHTTNHLNLGLESEKVPAAEFATLLESELDEPVTFIENRFGKKPTMLAYPYGVYSPRILEQVKKSGYELAFTVNPGPNDRSIDPLKLRRNLVLYPISHEKFAEIFQDGVLHLENLSPGDGEEIVTDKPLFQATLKDDIDPKTLEMQLGPDKLKTSFDPATHILTHQLTKPITHGGHMVTLAGVDKAGQRRVYTWYFRIKHHHPEKVGASK